MTSTTDGDPSEPPVAQAARALLESAQEEPSLVGRRGPPCPPHPRASRNGVLPRVHCPQQRPTQGTGSRTAHDTKLTVAGPTPALSAHRRVEAHLSG
jgi:hypothetical protein